MKLLIAVIIVLSVAASESFPSTRKQSHSIGLLVSKEPVAASEEFQAVSNAYFDFIAKSEETIWRAAKEIEVILNSTDHPDVAKDTARMFYKAYDAILYGMASVYNGLDPDDELMYTIIIIQLSNIQAVTMSYDARTKIEAFLSDNVPEVFPQVQTITERGNEEFGQHLQALYDVLDEYADYQA